MQDIPALLELINGYAAKGIMLPRTEFELSENMRDFTVAYAGNQLVGCGALHFYSPTMGEVRSLAVAESHKTHGIGRLIVDALVYEAKIYGLDAVFAFTYVPGFFAQSRFPRSGARRTAVEGLEGLPALPEVPVLRRDRGAARAASAAMAAAPAGAAAGARRGKRPGGAAADSPQVNCAIRWRTWHFAVRALRARNYRLFFSGQSISLIGTWMTRIATSWLVYRLTGSAVLLGMVGFAGQIPTFLLGPIAGVWVDRWDRHRTLVVTQALSMLQSLALAGLALTGIDQHLGNHRARAGAGRDQRVRYAGAAGVRGPDGRTPRGPGQRDRAELLDGECGAAWWARRLREW